jgi:predicted transcriptional regulator
MKNNKKLYSIRIHERQLEYLRTIANKNYTTVTQYITDLVNKDMKKNNTNE